MFCYYFLIAFQFLLLATPIVASVRVPNEDGDCSGGSFINGPPIVDLSAENRGLVISQIHTAMSTYGCFIATGHGITQNEIDTYLNANKALFSLSEAEKEQVAMQLDDEHFGRGYLGFGSESGLKDSFFEPKEGFSFGHPANKNQEKNIEKKAVMVVNEGGDDSSSNGDTVPAAVAATPKDKDNNLLLSPNIWPHSLLITKNEQQQQQQEEEEGLQHVQVMENMFVSNVRVTELIIDLLATSPSSTNIDDNNSISQGSGPITGNNSSYWDFKHKFTEGGGFISIMRLFHYFNRKSAAFEGLEFDESELLGSSPHTDWGLLTLILESTGGGLQFYYENQWLDVPHVEGGIIVNAGDYLSLLSGGVYHSPIHRVLCPINRDRYSSVFFYYPGYDSVVIPSEVVKVGIQSPSTTTTGTTTGTANGPANGADDTDKSVKGGVCAASREGKEDPNPSCNSGEAQTAAGPVAPNNPPLYNTLLKLDDDSSSSSRNVDLFGEYIIKKWLGVSRS